MNDDPRSPMMCHVGYSWAVYFFSLRIRHSECSRLMAYNISLANPVQSIPLSSSCSPVSLPGCQDITVKSFKGSSASLPLANKLKCLRDVAHY